ncbi:MAG: hypothetical protein Q9205_004906 [Flavoplaca limonia]
MAMYPYRPTAYAGALASRCRPTQFRAPRGRHYDYSSDSSCSCSDSEEDYQREQEYRRRRRYEQRRRRPARPQVLNDNPFPTGGRPLGAYHRAAQAEGITLSHIPGGCERHGRCEDWQRFIVLQAVRRRGVRPEQGHNVRQLLRYSRGLPFGNPDPIPHGNETQQAAVQQAPQPPPPPPQPMLEPPSRGDPIMGDMDMMGGGGGDPRAMMGEGGRDPRAMMDGGGRDPRAMMDGFRGDPRRGMGRHRGGGRMPGPRGQPARSEYSESINSWMNMFD